MTKEKLIELLQYPEHTGQAVRELKNLLDEYPYFHIGHQLYIKGLQQTSQTRMEHQLGIAAISVRDRSMLYYYLNNPEIFGQRLLPVAEAPVKKVFVPEPEVEQTPEAYPMSAPTPEAAYPTAAQTAVVEPVVEQKVVVVDLEAEKRAKEQQKVIHNTLITNFLSSNPKIVPAENINEIDMNDRVHDVTDIGTETLADIYATQGNKDKAVEIYEKLVLKYPEKSIYFAAQIKRLKE